ncbi:MAG: hypothetical protein GEU98_17745 [Pseudonocardiaceae bacterium]|nr:hypothetical protein [Pseudonocardiaceae bacterium]
MSEGQQEFDTPALRTMSRRLDDGARTARDAMGGAPTAPDAGFSTAAVAQALSAILEKTSQLANDLEDVSGKIRATSGAYDDVENTNEGAMKRRGEKPLAERAGGVH